MAARPPRPFTRGQVMENEAFLAALVRTGNAREAARCLGFNRSTFTKRRARHPAFATAWDAALATAHARLGPRGAQGGGETRLVRTASGRVQLRRATTRRLTRAAEQAFLAALSATANVRLAAAAAGFSHSAFYLRRREDPGFAREMRMALGIGYERLEAAMLESFQPESHTHDAWRHNDPPIPPMTPAQALHLLTLHQKEARLGGTPEPLRRRRGETSDLRSLRLQLIAEARLERQREAFRVAEAERRSRAGPEPGEAAPMLPALDQVAGWSKAAGTLADGTAEGALFGGWQRGSE